MERFILTEVSLFLGPEHLFRRNFRVPMCLCFEASPSAKPFLRNDFGLHENETACRTHFHMKGFALRLALKQRHKRTWKWPISHILFYENKLFFIDQSCRAYRNHVSCTQQARVLMLCSSAEHFTFTFVRMNEHYSIIWKTLKRDILR